MFGDSWILVVEPSASDQKLIELAAAGVAPGCNLIFVERFDRLVPAMSSRNGLPCLVVLDWFAEGDPASCLDSLSRLGFLSKFPIIVTARAEPMRALNESFDLGLSRFVSKQPDDSCFRKKIAEAISQMVPESAKTGARAAA